MTSRVMLPRGAGAQRGRASLARAALPGRARVLVGRLGSGFWLHGFRSGGVLVAEGLECRAHAISALVAPSTQIPFGLSLRMRSALRWTATRPPCSRAAPRRWIPGADQAGISASSAGRAAQVCGPCSARPVSGSDENLPAANQDTHARARGRRRSGCSGCGPGALRQPLRPALHTARSAPRRCRRALPRAVSRTPTMLDTTPLKLYQDIVPASRHDDRRSSSSLYYSRPLIPRQPRQLAG